MKITAIHFTNGDSIVTDSGIGGYSIDGWQADFSVTVDGHTYTGSFQRNTATGECDVAWNAAPAQNEDIIEWFVAEAFQQSAIVDVVFAPVRISQVKKAIARFDEED